MFKNTWFKCIQCGCDYKIDYGWTNEFCSSKCINKWYEKDCTTTQLYYKNKK